MFQMISSYIHTLVYSFYFSAKNIDSQLPLYGFLRYDLESLPKIFNAKKKKKHIHLSDAQKYKYIMEINKAGF